MVRAIFECQPVHRGGRPNARGRDKRKSTKRTISPIGKRHVGNTAKPHFCSVCNPGIVKRCYRQAEIHSTVREEGTSRS